MTKGITKPKATKQTNATQPMFSAEKREIIAVSLDQIQVDPRQPRADDPGKAANVDTIAPTLEIDKNGVAHPIQPIQIRPSPPWAEDKSKPWMIFDGECRYLGTVSRSAAAIDAVVVVMAEDLVFEAQMRTFARDGLGPAAQLEAIRRFDGEHPEVNAANAAVRLGMRADVVRALRKVNALPAEVRGRFKGGELTLEVCDSLGRIDGATPEEKASRQLAAARAVAKMDPKKAREHILKTYLLRLKDAPFDREDKTLNPEMGVCSACPNRTGAQASLFGTTDTADDCCTVGACWQIKARVSAERNPPPEETKEPKKKTGGIGKPTPDDVALAAKLAAGAEPEELDALFPDKKREEIDESLERLAAVSNPKAVPALQDRRAMGKDIGGFSRGSAHAIASTAISFVRDAMGRLSPSDTALFLRWVLESTGGFLTFIEPGAPTYDPAGAALDAVRRAIEDIDASSAPTFIADVRSLLSSREPSEPLPRVGGDGPASIDEDPADDEGAEPDPKEEADFADAEDDWREVPE